MDLLAVDAGNTHVKWAVREEGAWTRKASVRKGDDLGGLAKLAGRARYICAGNVGGAEQQRRIEAALGGRPCEWIVARAQAHGVVNRYEPPRSLGFDRWCALLAMRARQGRGIAVLAGTAVTVDPLPRNGVYEGGLILPGIRAMHGALAATTEIGMVEPLRDAGPPMPRTTAAAVDAGARHAVAGAVALMMADSDLEDCGVVASGGDAHKVAGFFGQCEVCPDLVFDGMAIAVET